MGLIEAQLAAQGDIGGQCLSKWAFVPPKILKINYTTIDIKLISKQITYQVPTRIHYRIYSLKSTNSFQIPGNF